MILGTVRKKIDLLRNSYCDTEVASFQIYVWVDGEAGSET
jgi:hypothetical protein